MAKSPKPFKPTPKRFHPRGTDIVYEDHDLLVVDKHGGLLSVAYDDQPGEISAYELLLNYVRKGNPKSRAQLHMVHRLDRDTSGVLVFAKHEAARAYLIDEWAQFSKTYQAVVAGILPQKEGTITSYLAEDPHANGYKMISVQDPGQGAHASTGYKVLRETKTRSLLELDLHTGKKNQIRVHLSEMGFPVLGDKKYGDKTPGAGKMALHAARILLKHPHTHQPMTFEAPVPPHFRKYMAH